MNTVNAEAQSDDVRVSKTTSSSPFRINSKLLIISILIFTILSVTGVVFWVLRQSSMPMYPPTTVREFVDANSPPANSEVLTETDLQSSSSTKASSEPLPSEPVADAKTLEILGEVQYEHKQTRDALMYFDDRIESLLALKPLVEAMITSQSDSADSLEHRIREIETSVDQIERLLLSGNQKSTNFSSPDPPFRLIAIDRWENQWNAVIELEGRIAMLNLHDTRAGWKLQNIDAVEGSAQFESSSGNQTTLKIH